MSGQCKECGKPTPNSPYTGRPYAYCVDHDLSNTGVPASVLRPLTPEPSMTRCSKCEKSDPAGQAHAPCELPAGHDGLCVAFGQTFDSNLTPAPLDFDAARDTALSSPTRNIRDALQSQARAYADAAVKAERARIKQHQMVALAKMLEADRTLYGCCLDTAGFAYWFNQLCTVKARDDHR